MSKIIKVLHTEWSDGWGGQEIRILGEMLAVREQGIEVFLACTEHAQIKFKAQEQGIKVFTLPFKGNTDLVTLYKLIRIIKSEQIDIVNTHSGKDTWVGGLAAKLSRVKFIRTRHLSNKIKTSRTNFINEIADYIITTGEQVCQDMIARNRIKPEKIISIPTGADEQRFNSDNIDKQVQREKLGIQENELVIGMVAVFRGFKRHDLFLKMARNLIQQQEEKQHKQLKFVLVGDGPQRDNILKLIKDYDLEQHIILTGHVNNVEELLSAFDIFILSSDSNEGVPQSVMQALLMKLPVIATNVGSTKDLLHDDNFILIEANDVALMQEKVSLLISDQDLREQYSQKARAYIEENFVRKNMCEKVIAIYHKILADG